MKLSEVLDQFRVIPAYGSEIVGFTVDADELEENITISWKDQDTGDERFYVFDEQEVLPLHESPSITLAGAFAVEASGGESMGFLALQQASNAELFNGEG